jgi:CRISPR/Cas system CSM-associated protein Csm3 (group 7 of RAMP superfamily)
MSIVTEQVKIDYTLAFDSAFHFGTGLRNGLIHRTVARNHNEYLYVPGSTLKGVLRDRCEQIAKLYELDVNEPHTEASQRKEANIKNPDIITRIFGSRFMPGQLHFDDALLLEEDRAAYFDGGKLKDGKYKARQVELRTQVSLSRLTRTAKPGHLYTSEYGLKMLRFNGQIYGHMQGFSIQTGESGTYSLILLLAGLLSLSAIGGNKSGGAGQVTCQVADTILIDGVEVSLTALLEQVPILEYYSLEEEAVNDL